MNDNWNNIDPDNSRGPVSYVTRWILILAAISLIGGAVFGVVRYVKDAGSVVEQQFSPSVMLKKYEWFKDASAQLDAKVANIDAAQARIKSMDDGYKGVPRNQWVRADVEQYNLWQTEVAGLKANYNGLAAEYNAQMAKFNYSFTNVGSLPAGATKVLPREYKPYM